MTDIQGEDLDEHPEKLREWPEGGLETVSRCPVCASAARSVLFEELTDKIFGCAPGKWTMVQCNDCRLGYLDPRPTEDTIGLAYETYYTHQAPAVAAGANDISPSKGAIIKNFVRACLNGYRNRRYGASYPDSSYLGGWIVQLIRPLAHNFDANSRYLQRPANGSSSVLDVGSGSGKFLHFAQDCGWQAVGIDFDEAAVAVSRKHGLNVEHGTLDIMHSREAEFDMVTASHVLEHVYSPNDMVKDMFRLLKPGGSVWLETPNIDALGCKRFGSDWRGLEPPRHLMLFSQQGLRDVFEKAGFVDVTFHNRGMNTFFTYAESKLIRKNARVNAPGINGSVSLGGIRDGIVEYFVSSKREFLTVTAKRPDSL